MTVHEFGKENKKTVVLIHPSLVMWDYFEYVIPLLETEYHLVVPALPGYDKDRSGDFTSVEKSPLNLRIGSKRTELIIFPAFTAAQWAAPLSRGFSPITA